MGTGLVSSERLAAGMPPLPPQIHIDWPSQLPQEPGPLGAWIKQGIPPSTQNLMTTLAHLSMGFLMV